MLIMAAISPYSTAVAPASLRRKRWMNLAITAPPALFEVARI
jgi:hypothetical protein